MTDFIQTERVNRKGVKGVGGGTVSSLPFCSFGTAQIVRRVDIAGLPGASEVP